MDKIAAFFLITVVVISGCSTISNNKILSKMLDVPPIPEPSSENRSAIAITVDQNVRKDFLNEGKI